MITIGIQGGQGSFSEEAANIFCKNHGLTNFKIIYQISSEHVLSEVETGKTDYGIFAMENAQGGVVIESVEALSKYRCDIIEMFHIPVNQNYCDSTYTGQTYGVKNGVDILNSCVSHNALVTARNQKRP